MSSPSETLPLLTHKAPLKDENVRSEIERREKRKKYEIKLLPSARRREREREESKRVKKNRQKMEKV